MAKMKPKFLTETDIPIWRRPGVVILRPGKTELTEYLGIDTVDLELGEYRVIASAAKYLADVVRAVEQEQESGILFDGSIQIYKSGIPGTDLEGMDVHLPESIWAFVADRPMYRKDTGLAKLIGDKPRDIERILLGYQARREERAAMRLFNENLSQASRRSSASPEPFYGGGGCC